MSTPEYQLHHACIYEKQPRDAMWTWLKWYHGIPAYYWEGYADMHHTGEGGVDYTFLACGGPFQLQLETGPYQFEYERQWFAEHDSGINHICWIVPNALETVGHLQAAGATVAMPYEEFGGTYNGFVAIDPEGRWVEIMEYVDGFKTPDVEFYPVGHVGLQTLGHTQMCNDLDSQVEWYTQVMGQKIILDKRHGACISTILYQAADVEQAWRDAVAAGFDEISAPTHDDRLDCVSGFVREPSGNLIQIRERLAA